MFHLGPFEVAPHGWTLVLIHAMQGKHVLGCVDCDALILHADGPWLVHDNPTVARDAVGPSTLTMGLFGDRFLQEEQRERAALCAGEKRSMVWATGIRRYAALIASDNILAQSIIAAP